VDGVLSADPRAVPDAVLLPRMSYDEACELAYFGAKVIHPQTMAPAIARGTPILIRNTFNPEHPGTRIDAEGDRHRAAGEGLVAGFRPGPAERGRQRHDRGAGHRRARVRRRLHAAQRVGGDDLAGLVRAFDLLRGEGGARPKPDASALARAFAPELDQGQIQDVSVEREASACWPRSATAWPARPAWRRAFAALARARVNVRAIAQGASERNISVAISSCDATKALRAAHAGFWLSPQTISLGVIGPGKVGAALLDQIAHAAPRLAAAIEPRPAPARPRQQPPHASGSRVPSSPGRLARTPGCRPAACDLDAFAAPRARRAPAACGDRRLQRQPAVAALCRMAGGGHPRDHAEQAGRRRPWRSGKPSARRRREAARASATKPRSAPACR
jgi:hypothetical protein